MGRWKSTAVFADFATPVALEKVLAAYEDNEARCPVCQGPLVPAEGTEGLYWRCETKEVGGERDGKPHYVQNLDKPIPRDGLIRCARFDCDGAVEFRQGEKAPFWRCTQNKRHRQAYHASHLRLPKMREVVVAAIGVRGLDQLGLPTAPLARTLAKPGKHPRKKDRHSAPPARAKATKAVPRKNGAPTQQELFDASMPRQRRRTRPELTPRETHVLQQLALHRSRSEIADALGLQPQSVKTYVRDLNRKFGTHDRNETVKVARALGCI